MKYEIDTETADKITLDVLKDHRRYLEEELENYENGGYLHPEDVVNNQKLIKHLTKVIEYFGG
jgi:acyl-CoA hydrolase